jgi:hypothetical protein
MDKSAYDMAQEDNKYEGCFYIKCSEMKGFWCSLQPEFSGRIPCSLVQSYTCPVAREHEKKESFF